MTPERLEEIVDDLSGDGHDELLEYVGELKALLAGSNQRASAYQVERDGLRDRVNYEVAKQDEMVATEREECAKLVERTVVFEQIDIAAYEGRSTWRTSVARLIRARGVK